MMQVQGTTVIDTSTGERYEFVTTESAYKFSAMWNKYETEKILSSGTTITFNGNMSVTPTCYLQFNLGDTVYQLDIKRKPTISMKLVLWLLGFKRIG